MNAAVATKPNKLKQHTPCARFLRSISDNNSAGGPSKLIASETGTIPGGSTNPPVPPSCPYALFADIV